MWVLMCGRIRLNIVYGEPYVVSLCGGLPRILWDVDLGSECIKKGKMKADGATAETCGAAMGTASGGICARLTRG
jgi:hypothetical protein